jgi:hypothetical protein
VIREPVGVVGAIVPWNVPQAISFLKLAPALAAGCTVVLKPAPETVLDAMLMAEAAIEVELPSGVLNVVPAGRDVGAYLVSHPQLDKVSFTGSTAAGRSVAETCGRLLRPVTLELGGKSAAIVLDDANLSATIESFFAATLLNNGQICSLSTRVLAPQSRYSEVVDTISGLASSLKIGDPLDAATQVGPLVSARQRDRVESYIAKGRAEGARLTAGGGRPEGFSTGWFVQPTVFADVDNNHTIGPGGDLRPGPVGDPLPRRGGGDCDSQRLGLRPGRQRLDRRPGAGRGRRPPGEHRNDRRQRLRQRSGRTVRRGAGQRHGPRARAGGPAQLPGAQEQVLKSVYLDPSVAGVGV